MALETALVVDDSATARVVLTRLLTQLNFDVISAKSGEEALQVLSTQGCDVIFLDHIMPGIDGFETLERLKQEPQNQHIPVIMYTSQAAHKYTQEAKSLGALGVISKQVTEAELAQVLERVQSFQQALQTPASNDETVATAALSASSPHTTAKPAKSAPAPIAEPNPVSIKTPTSKMSTLVYVLLAAILIALITLSWHTSEQNNLLAKLSRQIAGQKQQQLLADELIQDLNIRQAQQIESWREQQFMLEALYSQLTGSSPEPKPAQTSPTTKEAEVDPEQDIQLN